MVDARPTMDTETAEWSLSSPQVIFRETAVVQENLQVGQLRLSIHGDHDITHHNHHDRLIYPYLPSPPENTLPKLRLHIENSNGTAVIASPPSPPSTPLSSSSSSSPSSPTSSSTALPTGTDHPPQKTPSPRTPRVHFRSRVRIASGLPRSHRRTSTDAAAAATPLTSRSSSPSSSISAPLHSADGDESSSPLLGPLGKRVGLLAWRRKNSPGASRGTSGQECEQLYRGGERTSLLRHTLQSTAYGWRCDMSDTDWGAEEEEARLAREIEIYFGKWPGRLLNYRWWWWQLEPFICGLCTDESDLDH